MTRPDLILRNVEIGGRPGLDARLAGGRVVEIGVRLTGRGQDLDGKGGALIAGLADHHIHLLATAAQADSLTLNDVGSASGFALRLRAWADARPPGQWLRATGFNEGVAGLLDRDILDALAPHHPVRIQDRTGGLWMLNSRALAIVVDDDAPDAVERDVAGRPTGRIWRGDAWLHGRIAAGPPPVTALGAYLARVGITAVTDASASTDANAAAFLAEAHRTGDLPQRLSLMSAGGLEAPADGVFTVGPVKILLDDRDLPPLEDIIDRIAFARTQRRSVAVHCVTDAELALTLAAFDMAGGCAGDRIEHGGVIPADAIEDIARLGLTVVTQPAFVFERGDRYLDEIPRDQHDDLYRCARLRSAGVPVAASSDAPYATIDPWVGMRAAVDRRTRSGRPLGVGEGVSPREALEMYLGEPGQAGGPPRQVTTGAPADLVLLSAPLRDALDALSADLVSATFVDGRLVSPAAPTPRGPY